MASTAEEVLGNHDGKYGAVTNDTEAGVDALRIDGDNNNDESNNSSNNSKEGLLGHHWTIADFGHVTELSRDGSQHATDEVFNAASHLAASMFSLLGTVILISESSAQGAPWKIVSFSIYGASLMFLFVASTMHHSIVGSPEVVQLLRMIDYLAIYPLIAGTFTPLCLVFYHHSTIGWSFISVVWFLAGVGMLLTLRMFEKMPKWLSMTFYITIGWIGAFMAHWLLPVIGYEGMGIFALGGVLYTVGGAIYSAEKPNPIPGHFGFHEIWHIFVILAAATHWCLMYFFVLYWKHPNED
uniref:Hemolysin III n=1 Tax=Ditylum brightwellii TaxID=49249 RepID=A0A6U3QPW7_9STRA|mmetsp:Transcript_20235/g.30096  ORF Transcript_20235/g.30096 Transcript_20235/m.30096 type:complete len:297 (+) Transcript_20235:37-927(+)